MSASVLSKIARRLSAWTCLPLDVLDLAWAYTGGGIFRNHIRRVWPGEQSLEGAGKVVVFHHFDKRGVVHDYVVYFVRKLAEAGFAVIFTSNSRRLNDVEVEKIRPYVAKVMKRANVGWDFGAYKDAILSIPDPSKLDLLIITNDSIYGPLHDLSQTLRRANPAQADVWGITDSWFRTYHLQSYFLVFTAAALRHPAFQAFWRRVRYFRRKEWVIRFYEIGLTRFFLRKGVRCRALFPYRALISDVSGRIEASLDQDGLNEGRRKYLRLLHQAISAGSPLNQTHYFWDHLIRNLRCPFLKRDLLQKNPVLVPYVERWEEVVRDVSPYDTELIDQHLKLTMRNRVY